MFVAHFGKTGPLIRSLEPGRTRRLSEQLFAHLPRGLLELTLKG